MGLRRHGEQKQHSAVAQLMASPPPFMLVVMIAKLGFTAYRWKSELLDNEMSKVTSVFQVTGVSFLSLLSVII